MSQIETQIRQWRSFVDKRPAVEGRDAEELETHLRDQIAGLEADGLTTDEAFLIAVKRMGSLDEVSREFAREHSGRLWRQLVMVGGQEQERTDSGWLEALGFAIAAAVTVQLVRLAAGFPDHTPTWLLRNATLFVLPFLIGYFLRRRRLSWRRALVSLIPVGAAALVVNLYPFGSGGSTELLVAAHLPIVLWCVVAYPYTDAAVRSVQRRMDFVRFTGEWIIYYALIALSGGVLTGLTVAILQPAGIDPNRVVEWVLPLGAAGAVIVAAWLVEAKQRVVENMAPVLTMLFTPLFALMLIVAAAVYAATGLGGAFDRELLGVFDALMVVVVGLFLYGMSARDPARRPGWMDASQLVAVIGALLLDLMVLGAMVVRIDDLGFTPNRTVALGLNLVLLANLGGTAWLLARFLLGRGSFHQLERWQVGYLPVFGVWAALVVVALPPAFGFA